MERLREPWSDMTLRDARDDILAVLAALKQDPAFAGKIDWSRLGLMGHSLGGHVVLGMAGAWPAWRLPEVKAVVALSPLCVPFLVRGGTLGEMVAPVQFQGGTRDPGITPSVVRPGGCYDQTSAPARLIVFRRAGHLDWTDPVTRTQGAIIDHARGFLDVHLRGLPDRSIPARRHVIAAFRAK